MNVDWTIEEGPADNDDKYLFLILSSDQPNKSCISFTMMCKILHCNALLPKTSDTVITESFLTDPV